MSSVPRPLCQLLTSSEASADPRLSCAECFAILEFLADLLAAGGDPAGLQALVRRHLRRCPECRYDWTARLDALELDLFSVCRLPRTDRSA